MSKEPTLAYTVHHEGRKYRLGMTLSEIGPAAAGFGKHVWADGNIPSQADLPTEDADQGGSLVGTPPVPPPSGLPGGDNAPLAVPAGQNVVITSGDAAEGATGADVPQSTRKTPAGRRTS